MDNQITEREAEILAMKEEIEVYRKILEKHNLIEKPVVNSEVTTSADYERYRFFTTNYSTGKPLKTYNEFIEDQRKRKEQRENEPIRTPMKITVRNKDLLYCNSTNSDTGTENKFEELKPTLSEDQIKRGYDSYLKLLSNSTKKMTFDEYKEKSNKSDLSKRLKKIKK